jgi:hypothetical protein
MAVEEVAYPQWKAFLRSYCDQHTGWLARVVEADGQATRLRPLREVRLECVDAHDRIVFCFEGEDHVAPHPRHLRVLRAPDGADQGLEIVSGDGDVNRVEFREATRPETLDGMAPGELPPHGGRAA